MIVSPSPPPPPATSVGLLPGTKSGREAEGAGEASTTAVEVMDCVIRTVVVEGCCGAGGVVACFGAADAGVFMGIGRELEMIAGGREGSAV